MKRWLLPWLAVACAWGAQGEGSSEAEKGLSASSHSFLRRAGQAPQRLRKLTVHPEVATKAASRELLKPTTTYERVIQVLLSPTRGRDPRLACIFFLMCGGFACSLALGTAERWQRPGKKAKKEPAPEGVDESRGEPNPGGLQSLAKHYAVVFKLIRLWLTEPETKRTAWPIVIGLVFWWMFREFSWAFLSSAFHAEVTNKITSLHEHKDISQVYHAILVALVYDAFVSVPTFSLISPLVDYYSHITLRDFLTKKAMFAYLRGEGDAYYHMKLNEHKSGIDNPDQRITEDAHTISTVTMALYASVLSAIFGFSMWTAVIFGVCGPTVMFIGISFSMLRTGIAWFGFGTGLVLARQGTLRQAAELRYGLTRIRDSAEEIALGAGSSREYQHVSGLWDSFRSSLWRLTSTEIRYGIAIGACDLFPGVLLWTILLPSLTSGQLGVGDALRVHMAYEQVSKVFGFLVNNFGNLTDLQANAERYNRLLEACEASNAKAGATAAKHSEWTRGKLSIAFEEAPEGVAVRLENLAVFLDDQELDLQTAGMSATCRSGEGLLIMGPSGSGKTSLLRSVVGLWTNGVGTVKRPGGSARSYVQFLPSRCYLPVGTLKDMVCYPDSGRDDAVAKDALLRAHLGHLVEKWGLDVSNDWRVLLSLGEQQRIAFARLFCRLGDQCDNSMLAILDEATSALDVATEAVLYDELRRELRSGRGLRGFLSVGHRPQLQAMHDTWLLLGSGQESAKECNFDILASGSWTAPGGKATLPWKQLRRAADAEIS